MVVRDVRARRCVVKKSSAQHIRFEDVEIEHLTTAGIGLTGCLFRHVTLRGPVGAIRSLGVNASLPADVRAAMEATTARYYRETDWALDVTEAEFQEGEFLNVPGNLIRRDPETQFLLRRETVAGIARTGLPSYATIAISRFESTPFDTLLAIVPKRNKHFAERLAHLRELRDRGLAE
jgi:hypothetical protein